MFQPKLISLKKQARVEVLEENNYYPFGLKHEGYNILNGNKSYQYKYNGKELQETGMYDYGARFYMPDLGRWGVVDELAEKFSRHSPYNYVVNDPINGIDPDGRDVIFLADSKAVPVAGHGAVIVGNEKDGWYYYSMNGTGEGSSSYGDAKNADVGTFLGTGLSPKQAMLKANTINPVPSEKHHYDKFVTVKTTKEEDEKIKEAAAKAASAEKYCVIGQYCATVMLDSLNKIIDIRSNNAWYIPKVRDPAPNNIMDYFNKDKGGGINFLNRFLLPSDKKIEIRKVGKLEVGPVIPEGVDRNDKIETL
ncbi:RHS repeat-associated core domain-containing protein [Chryseobacterium nematophagum]|uniref:RHS repeat-associated core domain-containing protein n=1 Tax=Chryseobacterium nematophagum TaxID=2305228 RepID=A0A3M7TH40_9FLAO|nr:RHS repeat-associated core domain-containing protein [Chryseobacterium nematophagum]